MANRKLLTLCIIHEHPRVLLGMKKKGFGVGRWNGFGGKVEPGEEIEDAARREVREEAGIEVDFLEEAGVLDFTFEGSDDVLEVHVFRAEEHTGEPRETDEMRPQWFMVDEIPFKDMWPDDYYWFPLLLKRKQFKGAVHFSADHKILKKDFSVIEK